MEIEMESLLEHFREMKDGDQITFRYLGGKWQVISFDGDRVNVGFGETVTSALENEQ